jgi:transposase
MWRGLSGAIMRPSKPLARRWTMASGLASFTTGIVNDRSAVQAALTASWSNGQTEGQNTKLKLVKRQMYGRAKLDLLRACLLGAP